MWGFFQDLVAIQREIYLAFADRTRAFAETGDWMLLASYLPMGVVFGAVHALTPGHSKAVLATYLTGSTTSVPRGLAVSLLLSAVHVGMSVLIALLSLPLVSVALGSVGRAPLLENLSRSLLGVIGLWMLWQAVRGTGRRIRGRPNPVSADSIRDLRDLTGRDASWCGLCRRDDGRRGIGACVGRARSRSVSPATDSTAVVAAASARCGDSDDPGPGRLRTGDGRHECADGRVTPGWSSSLVLGVLYF